MKIAAIALGLFLAGCAGGVQPVSPARMLLETCDLYASSLNVLSFYRASHRLTLEQVVAITEIEGVMYPLCRTYPSDPATVQQMLTEAQFRLLQIENIEGSIE